MRTYGMVLSRRRSLVVGLVVALALGVAGPEATAPAVADQVAAVPTGPDVTYAHNANGRVTAAFDPNGDGARIGYDAVGNITGICPRHVRLTPAWAAAHGKGTRSRA